jgi:arthrofactin-type cyclic lipopeptide synthetase C
MFTSGSTGEPKGVTVAHRGITRLVLDASYVEFEPTDVVAFASNRAFDAATFEIWGALLNGARLVEIDRHTLLSPPLLAEALRTHGVTVMFMTAALFHQMSVSAPATFAGLRCLIAGGDVVDPAAAAAVLHAGATGRLVNGYGPTENTTFSATFPITAGHGIERALPIGRPIGGSTCYVLGTLRELLPVGAIGELYVGGSGLALGYVNDPVRTAERFVQHPFIDGERLYRTGDRARWRSDGQLEFHGRVDRQIKLRGHRIELEEIEHVLARHESVSACAVLLDTTRPADPRLVAYAAIRDGHAATGDTLADHLRRRLPAYMVPAAFVTLPVLPLTANGKVDRTALPGLRNRRRAADTLKALTRLPDAAEMESIVAGVFHDVLRLERVAVDDDFFELGGDSLGCMAVAGRLSARTRRAVSVTDVFAHPTVSALASAIRRTQTRTLPETLVEIRQGGARTPIYFPPGVLGELVVGEAITKALPDDVPLYGFRDPLDRAHTASLAAMAKRFCADINAFQPEGPISLAGYSFGGLLAYEMARQLRAAGREIRMLAIFDTGPDFSNPATTRESLLRLWRCVQNAPGWVAEDLLRSLNAEMPARLWRSIRNQARNVTTRFQKDAPQFVPRVEHLFNVRGWTPALYAHVENNLRILEAFTYEPYEGELVLFRARVRPLLHAHSPDLGWRSVARAVQVITLPGNHHTLMTEPHIHRLAASLKEVALAADRPR